MRKEIKLNTPTDFKELFGVVELNPNITLVGVRVLTGRYLDVSTLPNTKLTVSDDFSTLKVKTIIAVEDHIEGTINLSTGLGEFIGSSEFFSAVTLEYSPE